MKYDSYYVYVMIDLIAFMLHPP